MLPQLLENALNLNKDFRYSTVVFCEIFDKTYWVTLYGNPLLSRRTLNKITVFEKDDKTSRILLESTSLEKALSFIYQFLTEKKDYFLDGNHKPRGLKGSFVITKIEGDMFLLRTMNKCAQKGCQFRELTRLPFKECLDFLHDIAI